MYRALCVIGLSVGLLAGADWTRFRGPDGSGISTDRGLPTTWSATENIVWKTPMPGFGASSPITLGGKIFLTCYSGYGLDQDEPGEQEDLRLHVVCADRDTGKILWNRGIKARLPEREYRGYVALHGYASATPVTDGETVYAFFGRSGVFAYSIDGKLLWKRSVGANTHSWGSAASPILAGDLLIVNACVESGRLFALDKRTGKVAWQADGIVESWCTPGLIRLPSGNQELVLSMKDKVLAFDPASGERLWECESVPDYVCPSVVTHGDVAYITGGRTPVTIAVRGGGRGDVTKTHRLWKLKKTPKIASPLHHDGFLYWVSQRGVACCVDAETGKLVYQQRLQIRGGGDKVYASLVLADGKLYAVSRQGGTVVLAVGPELKQLAQNDLDDRSTFNATPVVSRGQLLLRSDRFLYCIGKRR